MCLSASVSTYVSVYLYLCCLVATALAQPKTYAAAVVGSIGRLRVGDGGAAILCYKHKDSSQNTANLVTDTNDA